MPACQNLSSTVRRFWCREMNISATGSNYGSNGQNGSSSAVNTGMINGESEGLDGRNENRVTDGSGVGNRVDENKLAQREAALLKFRRKRQERCFKKKDVISYLEKCFVSIP